MKFNTPLKMKQQEYELSENHKLELEIKQLERMKLETLKIEAENKKQEQISNIKPVMDIFLKNISSLPK